MKAIVPREIIDAKIIKDFVVEITFDNLQKREVDLRPFLGKGVFKSLLKQRNFRQMKLDAELGTICWPSGADIAPDRLYSAS